MTCSFYCPCGFHSNDYDEIAVHTLDRIPAVAGSCCNCGGQKCMDCVLRHMHDECEDSCPECCAPVVVVDQTDDVEILRSKVRSMGRIINHVNAKNARQARRIATLGHQAAGHPTPRVVRQIREIREAAGTNSVAKVVRLVALGRAVDLLAGVRQLRHDRVPYELAWWQALDVVYREAEVDSPVDPSLIVEAP